MRTPIGKQNAYAVALGGLNYFEFDSDGVRPDPLQLADGVRREFEARLMLFFTGRTRQASTILSEQKSNISQKIEVLQAMTRQAERVRGIIEFWARKPLTAPMNGVLR